MLSKLKADTSFISESNESLILSPILKIKESNPKLYIVESHSPGLQFPPEEDDGFVEYKRTLLHCEGSKYDKYATQMRWRITENTKKRIATYYIGVEDNGEIRGLPDEELIKCIDKFVSISEIINASIVNVNIIHVGLLKILKIRVKIKKIIDSYFGGF